MGSFKDLTGQKFNLLTAMKPTRRNGRVAWICECECGNESTVDTANLKSGHTKSCGCLNKVEWIAINCQQCGSAIERRSTYIEKQDKHFCSPQCSQEYHAGKPIPSMRTGKEINCKVCGKEFYVSGYRLKNGARFCSKECSAVWQIDHPRKNFIAAIDNSGEKNGMYKHGKRVGGHVSKKKVREHVIERDGDWCLICGKPPKGLHLHRIVYGSQGGKYEKDNCVQLCAVHHETVHSNKHVWLPILQEYVRRADENNVTVKEWLSTALDDNGEYLF